MADHAALLRERRVERGAHGEHHRRTPRSWSSSTSRTSPTAGASPAPRGATPAFYAGQTAMSIAWSGRGEHAGAEIRVPGGRRRHPRARQGRDRRPPGPTTPTSSRRPPNSRKGPGALCASWSRSRRRCGRGTSAPWPAWPGSRPSRPTPRRCRSSSRSGGRWGSSISRRPPPRRPSRLRCRSGPAQLRRPDGHHHRPAEALLRGRVLGHGVRLGDEALARRPAQGGPGRTLTLARARPAHGLLAMPELHPRPVDRGPLRAVQEGSGGAGTSPGRRRPGRWCRCVRSPGPPTRPRRAGCPEGP